MPQDNFLLAPGTRFGRLVVLGEMAERWNSQRVYNCRCDCGAYRAVRRQNLVRGDTLSCGCLNRERAAATARKRSTTHGLSHTPTYRSWQAMRNRCMHPTARNYERYGGRGITVCSRWHVVERFLADMGERPDGMTLDRIDNDGHYSCGHCDECVERGWLANCRWATAKQQRANRRAD